MTEADRQTNDRLRESMAFRRFVSLGYRPIAIGEDEIRRVFKFDGKCADMVFSTSKNTCLIADCKGTGIGDVIKQLENTATHVRKKYRHIKAQVLLRLASDPHERQEVGEGCTAERQTARNTPPGKLPSGAYILFDANGTPVTLAGSGEYVEVVFGP